MKIELHYKTGFTYTEHIKPSINKTHSHHGVNVHRGPYQVFNVSDSASKAYISFDGSKEEMQLLGHLILAHAAGIQDTGEAV